jgi:hypothetical protein
MEVSLVAGTTVRFNITAINTGTAILQDTVLSSPKLGPLTCPPGNATVPPAATYTCEGAYTVLATDLEVGQLVFTATARSPTLPAAAQTVNATQAVMVAQPQLYLDVLAATCNQTVATGMPYHMQCAASACTYLTKLPSAHDLLCMPASWVAKASTPVARAVV